MTPDLAARAAKRAEWAWRALDAAADDLRAAGENKDTVDALRVEAERVAGLIDVDSRMRP